MMITSTAHSIILGDSKVILQKDQNVESYLVSIIDKNSPDRLVNQNELNNLQKTSDFICVIDNLSKEDLINFCENILKHLESAK